MEEKAGAYGTPEEYGQIHKPSNDGTDIEVKDVEDGNGGIEEEDENGDEDEDGYDARESAVSKTSEYFEDDDVD